MTFLYKRMLYFIAQVDPEFTLPKANRIISQSVIDAYEDLDVQTQNRVSKSVNCLRKRVNTKGFSNESALIVLAAIGEFLNEDDKKRKSNPTSDSEER